METQCKNSIQEDVEILKKTVSQIQIQIKAINEDVYLTPNEDCLLTKSIENFRKGKTTSFEKLKAEIGV